MLQTSRVRQGHRSCIICFSTSPCLHALDSPWIGCQCRQGPFCFPTARTRSPIARRHQRIPSSSPTPIPTKEIPSTEDARCFFVFPSQTLQHRPDVTALLAHRPQTPLHNTPSRIPHHSCPSHPSAPNECVTRP
ncbi:hypothetical protein M3J09_002635 [Ascochyta lentis]